MTGTPLVSIIILNWNGFDDTIRCLDSLRQLAYPHFEVVLVDNGSSDGSRDRLPLALENLPYPVELVKNEHNMGFAGGNVVGLARCRGEFVALLNNDTVVDADWLSVLVQRMISDSRLAGVGGKSYFWNDDHPAFDRSSPFYSYQDIDPCLAHVYTRMGAESPCYVDNLLGCALLLRRSTIDTLGFLDGHFFAYYEETDLTARFLRSGNLVGYEPSAVVWHKVAASVGETSAFRSYHLGRNRAFFALRNFDHPYLRFFLQRYLRDEAMFLAITCWHRVKRRLPDEHAKARVRAFRDVVVNVPRLLIERRAIVRNGRYNDHLSLLRDSSVSVIISNHSRSRHIGETVESAFSQSHRAEQIIVVDHDSSDDSLSFTHRNDVTVVPLKTGGSTRAENEGFAASSRRFVLFVDAGDRLRPDAIRTYLRAVISDPRVSFVYSDAGHLGTKQGVAHGRPFSARALAKKNFIHTGVLIKREAFEAVGGYPHLTSRVAEDWDLLLSLAEHGHRGLYVPRALLDRREQGGSGRNSAEPGEYNRLREDMSRRHPRLDPMGRLRCVRAWRRWVFRDS